MISKRTNINTFLLKQNKFDLFQKLCKRIIGPVAGMISWLLMKFNLIHLGLTLGLWSHRVSYSTFTLKIIKPFIDVKNLSNSELTGFVSNRSDISEASKRTLIIRWPVIRNDRVLSKGVIIVAFTQTFTYYIKHINLTMLEKYFHIVLEPSWSGYCDVDILSWIYYTSCPVFVQATELLDKATLNTIGGHLVGLSIGASNWVDYNTFYPTTYKKKYDSVYVANSTLIKRVPRYLKAVSKIKSLTNDSYRAALVCASWGGKHDEIRTLIDYYNVYDEVSLYNNLGINQLRDVVCQSKVNILLSKKEGSNRSLFESIFCDVPVLALVDNVGTNKSYINEFTGMVIWDDFLEEALLTMKEKWKNYIPRKWALKNISPEATTEHLFHVIANHTGDTLLVDDLMLNQNIYIKVNRPEVEYINYPHFNKSIYNKKFLGKFLKSSSLNITYEDIFQLQNEFISMLESCNNMS